MEIARDVFGFAGCGACDGAICFSPKADAAQCETVQFSRRILKAWNVVQAAFDQLYVSDLSR